MTTRDTFFEYRAWPAAGTQHFEALHLAFGLGVSEIRTDTYIVLPDYPQCFMIIRGGTHFEIKLKTTAQETVSFWRTLSKSIFPLRRSVVRTLQAAFPTVDLPDRIRAPVDLISWLGGAASVFTVSKRMVRFQRGRCTVELTQLNTLGYGAETFSVTARRSESVAATLELIAGPRLANMDYGTWLTRRFLSRPVAPIAQKAWLASSQPAFPISSVSIRRPNSSPPNLRLVSRRPSSPAASDLSYSNPYLPDSI